jgi:hypothetical protein
MSSLSPGARFAPIRGALVLLRFNCQQDYLRSAALDDVHGRDRSYNIVISQDGSKRFLPNWEIVFSALERKHARLGS